MATMGGFSGVWGLGTDMPLGLLIEQSHASASAADPLQQAAAPRPRIDHASRCPSTTHCIHLLSLAFHPPVDS